MSDTKSYWDQSGKYQEDFERLYGQEVPNSGESLTVEGELIRAVSRLFYEYYNNGNCNAAHRNYQTEYETCLNCHGDGGETIGEGEEEEYMDCEECGGAGEIDEEVEGELEMNKFYGDFLNFIEEHVPNTVDLIQEVAELILDDAKHYNYSYNQEEMDVYNALTNKVMEHVLAKEKEGPFTLFEKQT